MPYRNGNFSFVIDSSFQPFTFQEMLQPWAMYSNAYEKVEDSYNELAQKADKFKYLAEQTSGNPRAKAIYEGYANELTKQAEDLAQNGLSIANRRALTGLKRRYQGEIGMLDAADAALQEEKKRRMALSSKDPSMLYAVDNLSLDSFLGNENPNLYGVSGTDLYTRGAAAGKAASSRMYDAGDGGKTLGGYYRDYIQKMGYSPEDLNKFGAEISSDFASQVSVLPELQQAANQILEANGVIGNLSGDNLKRAQQQVIRGIIDGSVYNEDHKPVRDEGVMSASAAKQYALQEEARNFERQINGYYKDANGNWMYDPERDVKSKAAIGTAAAVAAAKNNGKATGKSGSSGSGSSRGGSEKKTISKHRLRLTWDGNNPEDDEELANNPKAAPMKDDDEYVGTRVSFDELPEYAKRMVMKQVGSGKAGYYDYYFKPFKGGFFNDTEAELDIVPRSIVTDASSVSLDELENDLDLEE